MCAILTPVGLSPLRVPVVITILPRSGRVHVLAVVWLAVAVTLAVALAVPFPFARVSDSLPVGIVVAVVVTQRVPVGVVAHGVPVHVVVVRTRQRALALSAYETAT